MEYCAFKLKIPAKISSIHKVAIVDERKISLDMAYNKGLDIIMVLAAECGIPDVTDCHISLTKVLNSLLVKNLGHKSVTSFVGDNSVVADRYSAAFLTTVLECIKSEAGA